MVDINDIIEYEQGQMSEERMIDFFQELINSGIAWQLQGHYGRTAQSLIDEGICYQPE